MTSLESLTASKLLEATVERDPERFSKRSRSDLRSQGLAQAKILAK
jgi:hypothetical protein